MEINTTQEKMLSERGVIILPETIEHDSYEMVLALLLLAETVWSDKPIRLFCAGVGGSVSAAMAIADLVKGNPQVVGMLAGIAESSHVTIFAACAERYVFPLAQIGIHRIAWSSINSRQDASTLRLRHESLEKLEEMIADILAGACRSRAYDHHWWLERLKSVGSDECEYYSGDWMQVVGFAKPASQYGAEDTLASLVLSETPTFKPRTEMRDFGDRSSVKIAPFIGGYVFGSEDKEPTQPIEFDEVETAPKAIVTYYCPYCENPINFDDEKFVAPDGDWFCNQDHWEYYEGVDESKEYPVSKNGDG